MTSRWGVIGMSEFQVRAGDTVQSMGVSIIVALAIVFRMRIVCKRHRLVVLIVLQGRRRRWGFQSRKLLILRVLCLLRLATHTLYFRTLRLPIPTRFVLFLRKPCQLLLHHFLHRNVDDAAPTLNCSNGRNGNDRVGRSAGLSRGGIGRFSRRITPADATATLRLPRVRL